MGNRVRFFRLLAILLTATSTYAQTSARSPRLTSVVIADQGELGSLDFAVDTAQGLCGTAPETFAEPYFDTLVSFTIENPSSTTIRVSGFRYSVGGRRKLRSRTLATNGAFEIAPGESAEINGILTDVSKGGKRVPGGGRIGSKLGNRNVTFEVFITASTGRSQTLVGATSVVFRDVNRCTG